MSGSVSVTIFEDVAMDIERQTDGKKSLYALLNPLRGPTSQCCDKAT